MYQIGSTMSKDRKIKWMLDTIEHIDKRTEDEVLKYDYYCGFRLKVYKLFETVHNKVNGGYVRKTVNELSFDDINEKIDRVLREWDENQRFLGDQYTGTLYAKVREVNKLVQLLKLLRTYNFDDNKRWTFSFRDNAYHMEISDVGDINQNQLYDDADNPEDDDYLFEDYVNPNQANKNPTRTKVRHAENPEADPFTPKNPSDVHQLHYVDGLLAHLHTLI